MRPVHLGPGSIDRRKGHVALGAGVAVDLREFETQATYALANHDERSGVDAAVRALTVYAPVLPGHRLSMASAVAAAAQNRAVALLDVVMAAPTLPASPWLLETALRVDRYDDARLVEVETGKIVHAHGVNGSTTGFLAFNGGITGDAVKTSDSFRETGI